MPIELEGDRPAGLPVVKRTRIGETFVGAVVRAEQRDVTKTVDGVRKPVLKDNGKARQELVVTCVVMPDTTAPAGIGETTGVPAPGDQVRLILKGAAFGAWIEAKNALGKLQVGDVVTQRTTVAQAYDANGAPKGGEMTENAQIDALPRTTSVGIYGPITLRRANAGETSWVEAAEAAYFASRQSISAETSGGYEGDEEPF
jgi:hypothetical protein